MKEKIGDIYWITLEDRIPHPYAVFEVNGDKVKACRITTNQKKASMPGNIVLDPTEGGLEKPSIIDVADVISLDKSELGEYIGTLSLDRVNEIIKGIRFIEKSYFGK